MNNNLVQHTPGPFSDYFQVSYQIAETFTARLYSALILENSRPTVLWVSKQPFNLSSHEAQEALNQINTIDLIDPPLAPFDTYGLDAHGMFFLSFTEKITDNFLVRGSSEEMERRFFRAVRLINKVHQEGVWIGDLNPKCFWLNPSGGVDLTYILKTRTNYKLEDVASYDPLLLPFVAPEFWEHQLSARSDVYSLGLIGYLMIGNSLPIQTKISAQGLPVVLPRIDPNVRKSIPPALDEILQRAISVNPNDRYPSATELLEALVAINERTKVSERKAVIGDAGQVNILPAVRSTGAEQKPNKEVESTLQKLSRNSHRIIVGLAAIVFVIVLGLGFKFYQNYQQKKIHAVQEANAPLSGGSPELSESIAKMSSLSAELKDQVSEIQALASSPDPLSYNLLAKSAANENEPVIVKTAQSGIIQKLNQASLKLSAIQLEQWLRYGNKEESRSPVFAQVLGILDPAMPISERIDNLKKLAKQDLNIATRLAAALFFDLEQESAFQPLLKSVIADNLKIVGAEKLSGTAIIMQHEALYQIFRAQAWKQISTFKEADIRSLLVHFAKRDQVTFRRLVSHAIFLKLYAPIEVLVLEAVRDDQELDPKVAAGLFLAVDGRIEKSQLNKVLSWQSPETEKILFALLHIVQDPALRLSILDNLATRSLKTFPGLALVKWIKDQKWNEREKYIPALGVLGNYMRFPDSEIIKALKLIGDNLRNKDLQQAMIREDNQRLGLVFIRNFAEYLTLPVQLNLLQSKDIEYRRLILESLDTNDVGAMKLIVDAYEAEKDPELREVYQSKFWFVKNRD